MPAPLNIILIDDHPLFRKAVLQLVDMAEDFTVVGEASSGPEGLELAQKLQPDMVLLDLYYAYNRSLSMDMNILYETVFAVLAKKGAH